MFIPSYSYLNDDCTPAESDDLPLEFPIVESDFLVEKVHKDERQVEKTNTHSTPTNNFFKGLLYSLPVCIAFWGFVIWGIIKILMSAGGGSNGTG